MLNHTTMMTVVQDSRVDEVKQPEPSEDGQSIKNYTTTDECDMFSQFVFLL